MFACNDHRNGSFAHEITAVEFRCGDHHLSLMSRGYPAYFEWFEPYKCIVGGQMVECSRICQWVGNWCWDSCLTSKEYVRLIAQQLAQRDWVHESGSQLMWDWFESVREEVDEFCHDE